MKYDFFAETIDIGIDEPEEVYAITFTDPGNGAGPPDNYLLLQRSVSGAADLTQVEPYTELNDAVNGRFASCFAGGELLPTYLHLRVKPSAGLSVRPDDPHGEAITDLVVRFKADAPTLRKLKYGLELVIGGAFEWRSLA